MALSRNATLLFLAALSLASASCRSRGSQACARVVGVWHGDGLQADPDRDQSAAAVVTEVVREERWRIMQITDTALQRERVGLAGGRPVAEPLYVTEDQGNRCVAEIRGATTPRRITMTLQSDGRLAVRMSEGWYTAFYRRPGR